MGRDQDRFADWDRITLYVNGTLVWGVEPPTALDAEGEDDDQGDEEAGCQSATGGGTPAGLALAFLAWAALAWRSSRRKEIRKSALPF